MAYRVIQWATGTAGKFALRAIINRPELELAGVVVHSAEKVGMDAGKLLGGAAVGVEAISELHDVIDLEADCVSYMPLPSLAQGSWADLDIICALLESGKNVVTTVGFLYPSALGDGVLERLNAACRKGHSTLHGTGLNPGFMSDMLPLIASGLCAKLERIYARECSDVTDYPSEGIVFDTIGLGREVGIESKAVADFRHFLKLTFTESAHLLAHGLGVELDGVDAAEEHVVADRDYETLAGTVRAGTVRASRWTYTGRALGRELIALDAIYQVGGLESPAWHSPGMAVVIDGKPRVSIDLGREWLSNGLLATAAHAINAIPLVCDAGPGVKTMLDLPLPRAILGDMRLYLEDELC